MPKKIGTVKAKTAVFALTVQDKVVAKTDSVVAKTDSVVAKTESVVAKTDADAEVESSSEKKTRIQLSSVLGINISQARCATHLRSNLLDETIEAEIKTLRATLKSSEGTPENTLIKAQIADKLKLLVRISSETPIAVAVIWDGAVKELLRNGMDQAILNGRKIVEINYLHNISAVDAIYYPLYSNCVIWNQYDPAHEEDLKKERATLNKTAKDLREAKKLATAEVVSPGQIESAQDDDESSEENTKTTFYTYVENALKTVKKDEPYKNMRVSNRVREYLSDLVAQGIARQALLARILVQRVMGVRTMNADHIKAVIHVLMADNGKSDEQINVVTTQIDDKLELYHLHLSSEKAKKLLSFNDEQKNERERQKRAQDLIRKKKQAELAKKRSVEAAQKASALSAETDVLEPIVAADKLLFPEVVAPKEEQL